METSETFYKFQQKQEEIDHFLEEIQKYNDLFKSGVETDLVYVNQNSTEDLLLAAAEELMESGQAILKLLRTRGIGMITPKTEDEAIEMVKEEFADANALLMLSMYKLGFLEECATRHLDKSIKCALRESRKKLNLPIKGEEFELALEEFKFKFIKQ